MKTQTLRKALAGLIAVCTAAASLTLGSGAAATNRITSTDDDVAAWHQIYFVTDLAYADLGLGDDNTYVQSVQLDSQYAEGAVLEGKTELKDSIQNKLLIKLPANVMENTEEKYFSMKEITDYHANKGVSAINVNFDKRGDGTLMISLAYMMTPTDDGFGKHFDCATQAMRIKFDEGFTLAAGKTLEPVIYERAAGAEKTVPTVVTEAPPVDPTIKPHKIETAEDGGYSADGVYHSLYFNLDIAFDDWGLAADVPSAQADYRYGDDPSIGVLKGMDDVKDSLQNKLLIYLDANVIGNADPGYYSVKQINDYFALPANGEEVGISVNLLKKYTGKAMIEVAYKVAVFGAKFDAATTDLKIKFDEGFVTPNKVGVEAVIYKRPAGTGTKTLEKVKEGNEDGPYEDPDYATREKSAVISAGAPYDWNKNFVTDITFNSTIDKDYFPDASPTTYASIQAPERIGLTGGTLSEAVCYTTREYMYINGVKLKDILTAPGNTDFTVQVNVTASFTGTTNYNMVIAWQALGIDEPAESKDILKTPVTIEFKEGLVDFMGCAVRPMKATWDPEAQAWETEGVEDGSGSGDEDPDPDPNPDPDIDPDPDPDPDNQDPNGNGGAGNNDPIDKTGVATPVGMFVLAILAGGAVLLAKKRNKQLG